MRTVAIFLVTVLSACAFTQATPRVNIGVVLNVGRSTAFFVSANCILTTYHASQLLDAEFLGIAPEKDLALFRTNHQSSFSFKVVQTEYHPHGFERLMTINRFGQISEIVLPFYALREVGVRGKIFRGYIISWQKPGNSGSPLLNADGEVIGIVIASSGYEGFAIPISQELLETYFPTYGKECKNAP